MHNHDFQIGDDIRLVEGVERVFSDCEHGVIKSFYMAPLGDLNGAQYAHIQWADGTESALPVGQIVHDEILYSILYGVDDFDNDDIIGCDDSDGDFDLF